MKTRSRWPIIDEAAQGRIKEEGGGSLGPPNYVKKEKTLRMCMQKHPVLVLNSYPEPPVSEILYPPLTAYGCFCTH